MENTNHDETLLSRWLADKLTEEELGQLQQREDYADLQTIVEGLKGFETPPFSEQDAWEKLQAHLQTEPKKEDSQSQSSTSSQETTPLPPHQSETPETPIRTIGRRNWIYGIAAALALAFAALIWLQDAEPKYSTMLATKAGEQRELTLPDRSDVQINAATTIGYTATDWPDHREVYLDGEAFFQAKKGKTFTVFTQQGTVKVVGTKFNVFARGNELEVKCTGGQVQVINPEGTEKVLIKYNEQVSVVNGRMQRRRGLEFSPKWYKGESIFKSVPRTRVLNELERQYGVTVINEDSVDNPHTGKFPNDDLEKALRMVAVPMGLKFEMSGDTIRFYREE